MLTPLSCRSYVSQVDIHEPTQTVREALEFSALLRQPASVSREEKIAYVDKVIDLLELNDIADAIIGNNVSNPLSFPQPITQLIVFLPLHR